MNTTAPSPAAAPTDARHRPTKKLPTFRIGFAKQLDMLRAYALLSENGTKAVHYGRVAEIIKAHEANVSSANPFFLDIGLLTKAANGYLPAPAVLDYNRAYSWKPDIAIVKLQPIIASTWFAEELSHRLQFRPLSEDAAIQVLADACNAGPEAKPQLRVLLDLCAATQIIDRVNGQLTLLPIGVEEGMVAPRQQRNDSPPEQEPAAPQPEPAPSSGGKATVSTSSPQKEGAINLDIAIRVDLAEMRDWSPDRITAFFGGIAQILAAKNQSG